MISLKYLLNKLKIILKKKKILKLLILKVKDYFKKVLFLQKN